jgi:hypothetical protein
MKARKWCHCRIVISVVAVGVVWPRSFPIRLIASILVKGAVLAFSVLAHLLRSYFRLKVGSYIRFHIISAVVSEEEAYTETVVKAGGVCGAIATSAYIVQQNNYD